MCRSADPEDEHAQMNACARSPPGRILLDAALVMRGGAVVPPYCRFNSLLLSLETN